MRLLCCLFMLLCTAAQATNLAELMDKAKANPQVQLEEKFVQSAATATDFFLLAYSHYVLKNKEAALEFSNKALTLEPDAELAGRILLMQALTFGVYYRDTAQAIEKLKLAQAILPQEQTASVVALRMDILESFSQAYNQQGQAELAMQTATESLTLALQMADKQRQLDAMIILGRLHLQNNDLTKAYQHFRSALLLASETKDQQAIASISMRLGMAYQKLGQHEAALQHFGQAAELFLALQNQTSQANALINMGDSQLILKQTAQAKATYDKALQLAEQSSDPYIIISAYVSLSELAVEQNQLDQAEQLLVKAHQLASQVSAQSIKAETALFLANVFIKTGQYQAARRMLQDAAPQPDKLVAYLKRKYLALSAELAASEQQWQQAYELEKSANLLEIAELNDTSKIQLDSLQSSLEFQMQQEKLQQENLQQQRQLKIWLVASLLLFSLTLIVLLVVLKTRKKSGSAQTSLVQQWRHFTQLLQHYHKAKHQGHLLVIYSDQTPAALAKGLRQVSADFTLFRQQLDKAIFWVEQDQEFWLYCASKQQASELQQLLLDSVAENYQLHSALLPLHELLSGRTNLSDFDALRELFWYSLHLAQQQGIPGALELDYHCRQNRPCSWSNENLRQDLFNAISLGLLEIKANGISLSDSLQRQLAQI